MTKKADTTKEASAAAKNTTKETKKEEKKVVEIIRGRMPLPIVHMIKFGTEGETDGAVAAKFRTTNGKVSDIRKDRNFGYIHKDYVPSADMIEKATAYAEQLEDKSVLKAVKAMKPATEEQNKAFDEVRKASRPKKETPVTPAEAEADANGNEGSDNIEELTA